MVQSQSPSRRSCRPYSPEPRTQSDARLAAGVYASIIGGVFDQYTAFKVLRRVAHSPIFWLGGPLLLYAWTIPGPFVFDDLNLLRKTEQFNKGERPELDLFSFAPTHEDWMTMRSRGTYPWWAPENHRIDFQRPIAQRSFWLDVKLFGRNPIGPRIESLALFLIALVLVHRMFRCIEADSVRAGLATFLLGISQCLAQPVAFISNRSDLFVLIGLAMAGAVYFQLGKRSRLATATAGMIGFVFALMSKEPAVAFAAVVVGHVILSPRIRSMSTIARAQRWYAGAIALAATSYLVWYAQTSEGSAGTFDLERIVTIGQSFLLYATIWGIGIPIAILPQMSPTVGWIVAAAGTVCWLAIVWIVQRQWHERRTGIVFFALWTLAFVSPALLTIPESRALSIATVGWAWLLAGLLMPRKIDETATSEPSIWVRQWFLAANGIVSVCCVVGTIYLMNHYEAAARERLQTIAHSFDAPLLDGDTVIVLAAASPFELICAGDRMSGIANGRDVRTIFLSLQGANAQVRRVSSREFTITGEAPALFDTPTHRLTLGANYRPRIGDTFELDDFTLNVAALNGAGEVTSLQMTIHQDVNLDTLRFFPAERFGDASGGARRD